MNNNSLVLIVEDEIKLAKILQEFLEHSGYRTHIITQGNDVVDWIKQHQPDLMLLDLMLPGKDGLDICREVRQFSNLPIIMTTARVEEIDRLLGLELGADDYVCKPYSPREVTARVKAQLRRSGMNNQSADSHDEDQLLKLDPTQLSVRFEDHEQILTSVEFALLHTLYQSPGRIFSRNQLMDSIYTDQRIVSDRTVDSHIKKLRQKLHQLTPAHEFIHSVYGAGYRYEYES